MSHLRIACNPLCWMNSDIPTLGSHIPVEQCLSEISMIGYAGVELEDPLRDALQLRPHILRERHLDLVAAWHGTRLLERSLAEEVEALKRHIDLIYPLGARVINVAEVSHSVHREPGTGLSCRPRPTESQWDLLAERLDRLVELMEEAGMRSAYHHHMGCLVQTEEDIDSLMQRTERVELLLDTGHLFYAGGDALRVIEKHGARIRHVHAKNVRKGIVQRLLAEDASFPTAILSGVFTVPGDGGADGCDGLDFRAIVAALAQKGFDGWLVMEAEQDPSQKHPLTYARLGYHFLQWAAYHAGIYAYAELDAQLLEV